MAAQEIELKFETDAPGLAAIEAAFPHLTFDERRLSATYFDTMDHALRRAGFSLRVRTGENSGAKQTLKGPGGAALFSRTEWEAPASGDAPDAAFLAPTPAPGILADRPLIALFRIDNRRRTARLLTDEGEIELALDDACAVAGDRRQPFIEVELELKSGDERTLAAAARHLRTLAPLTPSQIGKAERGYRLLGSDAGSKSA